LAQSGSGVATPDALKAMLAETAETLFASERDRRLYRVLELTYFNPAPKQEAAAERLGMSFSTYRRHLAMSVDRLTDWLWQQEQELRNADSNVDSMAEQAIASGPDATGAAPSSPRPRLSIVILPFLNLSREPSVDYLVDGIVDTLIDRLRTIGASYTAIHIRHTDYQTKYGGELIKLQPLIPGAIFLATDNRAAFEFCRSIFGNDRVHSFARLPDRAGKPLHLLDAGDPMYEINKDAIVDLLLLSLARRFHFFSLESNIQGAQHSGFTVLANRLRNFPSVLHYLIGRCDETLDAVLPIYR